jgi:hypothetical protein
MRRWPCGAHGSTLKSRWRFGAALGETAGARRPTPIEPFCTTGLVVFSGPGAPRTGVGLSPTPVCGVVETVQKSAALLFVSCTGPVVSLRTKACSEVEPRGASSFVPSLKRSQVPPEPASKPTASRRCAASKLDGLAVLKSPTLRLFWMPAESGRSGVAVTQLQAAG